MKKVILSVIIMFTCLFSSGQDITLKIEPNPLVIEVGQTAKPKVTAFDIEGNMMEESLLIWQVFGSSVLRFAGVVPSSGAEVDSLGNITAKMPGIYNSAVIRPGNETQGFTMEYFVIEVRNAAISEIQIENLPERMYSGTTTFLEINVRDAMGFSVDPGLVDISTADPSIASVDALGNIYFMKTGKTKLVSKAGNIENTVELEVIENPVMRIDLGVDKQDARTGDVLTFTPKLFDKKGSGISDVPVLFGLSGTNPQKATGASAQINQNGKFVAEKPGVYTIIASCGSATAFKTIKIVDRDVNRGVDFIGQGSVTLKHTSDFWVWEGVDGRDYAVTGTHSADGTAYFWDVTSPGNITLIDSIQVDARTVNDVKVSADGKICIISREGASNRKNGIVILDVADPGDVKILSTYTEQLTGGVHNLFIYEDHVYALSNGQRYEIINISDPANPYRVSKFEIENTARSIHDVWIEDGIAYSSNWNDGILLADIGNGIAGGSPEHPVEIMRSKVEGDANHAAFPYYSKSTGKRYVIAGDEIFPRDFSTGKVIIPSGYLHFIDISDPDNPVEVARYEVPEAGSHNMWVEDDVLYVGYYNAGIRVVDISGELLGDLYKQGREIGHFLPMDPKGLVPNNAMTWGAQPHKGHVFFSDYNSGLWAIKVKPQKPDEATIEMK